MIPLRKVLQIMEKNLDTLSQNVKDMQKLLDNIEEVFTAEAPRKKTTKRKKPVRKKTVKKPAAKKKAKKETATDAVLNIIQRTRKGVTTAQVVKRSGLSEKQIWGIVNRAKKQGKIKSEKKGVYVKI